jgi:hypothetical protein
MISASIVVAPATATNIPRWRQYDKSFSRTSIETFSGGIFMG